LRSDRADFELISSEKKSQINNLRYKFALQICVREESSLAWIIALVLLIFYGLGLFVFHGTRAIHLLPSLALVVLISDYFVARHFRKG